MRRTNKKGFTIVELVIVIAVIAILAAVLIPTFSSLVKKANLSADQQAVKQMNTALAVYTAENGTPKSGYEVKQGLSENGINAYTLNTVSSGYAYYWDNVNNEVVLIGSDNTDEIGSGWVLLSSNDFGVAPTNKVTDAATFRNAIDESSATKPILIELDQDVDLQGVSLTIAADKVVILDLNGKKLTATVTDDTSKTESGNTYAIEVQGSLTVKNGTINSNANKCFLNENGGTLTMQKVDFNGMGTDNKGFADAVFVDGNCSTTIIGCEFNTKGWYTITSNSLNPESDGANLSIINSVFNATEEKDATPICITINANVLIDGCIINGTLQGIYMHGCNATIKNTKVSHRASVKGETYAWSSGNLGPNCDIILACGNGSDGYTAGSYVLENVTTTTSDSELSVVVHNPENKGSISVQGITDYHYCIGASGTECTANDTCAQKGNE